MAVQKLRWKHQKLKVIWRRITQHNNDKQSTQHRDPKCFIADVIYLSELCNPFKTLSLPSMYHTPCLSLCPSPSVSLFFLSVFLSFLFPNLHFPFLFRSLSSLTYLSFSSVSLPSQTLVSIVT